MGLRVTDAGLVLSIGVEGGPSSVVVGAESAVVVRELSVVVGDGNIDVVVVGGAVVGDAVMGDGLETGAAVDVDVSLSGNEWDHHPLSADGV